MSEGIKNYLRLDRLSLFHCFCAYFDSEDYQADSLFIKHQVPVKFLQEYVKSDVNYRLVFYRVRKKDEAAFLAVLCELPNTKGIGFPLFRYRSHGLPILSTFMSSTYVVVFILDLTIQAIEKHAGPDINPGLRAFNSILRLEE